MGFTYDDAVAALQGALRFGTNPSLDTITTLCETLGRPQDAFEALQVAGTNGKTSVTWMTEAILTAESVVAGAYTSPHLHEYTERVRVAGDDVSRDTFATAVETVLEAAEKAGVRPTEFEIMTAAALWIFRELGVDVAVLEVGMGGRWDATTVVDPAVVVVTGVGVDHTEHLGTTREEIAVEKAQVIAAGSTAVLGSGVEGVEHVFLERAGVVEATVVLLDEASAAHQAVRVSRRFPTYQAANAAMAAAAAAAVLGREPSPSALESALDAVRLPARFETLSRDPRVIVDGSHNPQAAHALATAIGATFGGHRPVVLLGMLDDKDAAGFVEGLLGVAESFAVTRGHSARSVPVEELAATVAAVSGSEPQTYPSVEEALQELARHAPAGVVVTGSLTVAAEARRHLLGPG